MANSSRAWQHGGVRLLRSRETEIARRRKQTPSRVAAKSAARNPSVTKSLTERRGEREPPSRLDAKKYIRSSKSLKVDSIRRTLLLLRPRHDSSFDVAEREERDPATLRHRTCAWVSQRRESVFRRVPREFRGPPSAMIRISLSLAFCVPPPDLSHSLFSYTRDAITQSARWENSIEKRYCTRPASNMPNPQWGKSSRVAFDTHTCTHTHVAGVNTPPRRVSRQRATVKSTRARAWPTSSPGRIFTRVFTHDAERKRYMRIVFEYPRELRRLTELREAA